MRRSFIVAGLALLLLYAALAFGIYNGLTSRQLGANDFYSRWMGARALFLRGQNPYSDAVTRDIQIGMYGRLARADEDQVAFAYPLFAAYLAAPLTFFSYDVAQALWMALLVMLVPAGALALAVVNRARLTPLALTAILLGALFFYPTVRGIFLGNYTLVSFALLAFSILAIEKKHNTAAGIFLALAAVKPQPVIFLLPVILFWAWSNGRRRVVSSTLLTLGVLIFSSFLLLPTWLTDFLSGLRNYAAYASVGPPAETLWKLFLPQFANALTIVTSALLFVAMLVLVWRKRKKNWFDFQTSLGFVALVTTMIAVRIGTPDQVLLLILWMAWLAAWCARKEFFGVALAVAFLILAPWLLFFATLTGDTEALAVTTLLPWFTLGVFGLGALYRARRNKLCR